jgi:DNA invertase Pin-like site-specific DNA recombinase
MDVALYARVSSEEQAQGEKVSIDQQLAEMRALCKRRDWNVAGVFVDCKDYKATQNPRKGKMVNPSGERADRPAFLELLDLLKTGDLGGVACWRDDRLVRHPRVAVVLEDALDIGDAQRNGKGKIEVFDATGAALDRFTLSIKATIWREENKRRVERVRMGKVATLQAGRWPGTYTRLGYQAIKEPGRRGRLIVLADDSEVQTVKDIYNWYDSGLGMTQIRRQLIAQSAEQKGDRARKHDWALSLISRLLRTEDYMGKAVWMFADGSEYSVDIPQIVTPQQWKRVQSRREQNKAQSTRNAKGVYLLQGILYCGECGQAMGVRASHHYYRTLGDGTRRKYHYSRPQHRYFCRRWADYPEEGHPTPGRHGGLTLDQEVWRYLVDNCILHPDMIRMQVLTHQEELQRQGESVDGDIAHARRKLAEIGQERAFYQKYAGKGKMTEKELDDRLDETEDARRYWQGELERLQELRDNAAKVQNGLEYATELLTSLQARLPEIDIPHDELTALPRDQQNTILRKRQEIIRALSSKVIVWADRRVKLVGVVDGTEGMQFGLPGT